MGNPNETKMVDILWGGYYTYHTSEGHYSVFRLLDFTPYGYHAALFKERFSEKPQISAVESLGPTIGHVPLDSKRLYYEDMQVIGHSVLVEEELDGYGIYLKHHGYSEEQISELLGNLINKQPAWTASDSLADTR